MVDESGYELKDYKIFAFDGEAKAMFIASDRTNPNEETKFDFFDMDFNHLPFTNGHPNSKEWDKIKRPKGLDEMKKYAEILSKGLPEARIDFYDINGKVYFGEITFSIGVDSNALNRQNGMKNLALGLPCRRNKEEWGGKSRSNGKRNILFVMSSLRNGGAERSLVNLLQLLDYDRYNVDLLLFQNEGMFLKQVPKEVNIISNCNKLYTLYDNNKTEALKHPYLSVVHMIGTFISRKKTNSVAKSRQYRWEHFYKKSYQNLQKNTMWQSLICSANKHIFL